MDYREKTLVILRLWIQDSALSCVYIYKPSHGRWEMPVFQMTADIFCQDSKRRKEQYVDKSQ